MLVTSDYPIEKVVLLKSGSLSMTAPSGVFSVPYDLPFTPLCNGVWSLTPDFAVTYNLGAGSYPSGNPAFPWQRCLEIGRSFSSSGVNSSEIIFGWINLSTTTTVYYRVYGLEPSSSINEVPFTDNIGDDYIINTDYNYQKVFDSNFISGLAANSTYVITHNLGWRARAMFWGTRTTGYTYPIELARNDTIGTYGFKIIAGLNNITIQTDSTFDPSLGAVPTRLDYRIYLDEAGND